MNANDRLTPECILQVVIVESLLVAPLSTTDKGGKPPFEGFGLRFWFPIMGHHLPGNAHLFAGKLFSDLSNSPDLTI